MNTSTLKTELAATVTASLGDFKISREMADNVDRLAGIARKFQNDDIVPEFMVRPVIDQFTVNPENVLKDSKVIDGVLYPDVTSEEGLKILNSFEELLQGLPADGAASVAFVTLTVQESIQSLIV